MIPTYKRIDLSHTISDGMVTYQGLPATVVCDFWTRETSKKHYANDTSFSIGKIEMIGNTGTYIDAPFHRFENGKDLSQLTLDQLAQVDCICIKIGEAVTRIDKSFFEKINIQDKAVLVFTNWARHWQTAQYFENYPYLTADAAHYLVNQNVKLVGIDSYNIDDNQDGCRPVHTILLGANIPIVEHLCHLDKLPIYEPFLFTAVPPKIKKMASFPVRAFAMVKV